VLSKVLPSLPMCECRNECTEKDCLCELIVCSVTCEIPLVNAAELTHGLLSPCYPLMHTGASSAPWWSILMHFRTAWHLYNTSIRMQTSFKLTPGMVTVALGIFKRPVWLGRTEKQQKFSIAGSISVLDSRPACSPQLAASSAAGRRAMDSKSLITCI
jgi:hypothetical protein